MDRNIVYPGSIPLDTDILALNRNAMVGIGALTAAVLGNVVVADGLACMPTSPTSLTVNIGPGSITQLSSLDATAYGSLPADLADQIVKTGINLQSTSFTLSAPVTSGQSVNYLIEAAFSETDGSPFVLPYVNTTSPAQPYSGPSNSGTAQNTQRLQRVQLQLKAGAAAAAGAQTTPAVDTGWVGLYEITVNYGQSAITAANISVIPGAPFLNFKLPNLRPGFSALQVFTSTGTFTVPNGVTSVRVRVLGGGASSGYHSTMPGAGGGAGGEAYGIINNLTPGQAIAVTVGAGGAALTSPGVGNSGGTSSFGTFMSATGGVGGSGGTAVEFSLSGGAGGIGTGGQVNRGGSYGSDSIVVACRGGDGGGPGNGRGSSGPTPGLSATGYGGGGGGGGTTTSGTLAGSLGGAGAPGIVIVEY
ncbi:MAG: hypothetical protein B7Z75_03935 [Acidocella sp. 20-57-95]|nr:MAG: hypothetical protein B7Z75_03935 [Acidocella sp. 20-57-95]HQT63921.1 hypothetical protein [Acidocella sp.]HQU05271.1 hypothetical protein [Acidocella sp.]